MTLSAPLIGILTLIVLLAGALNGVAGFGFAVVGTMALATMIDPATAVVFMIFPILSVNVALVRDLTAPELRTCGERFAPLILAALVGTVVGMVALQSVPAAPLKVGLGLISLAFVVTVQDAVRLPGLERVTDGCFVESPLAMVGVGSVSGVLFGGTNVGVQLIAYLRSCDLSHGLFVGPIPGYETGGGVLTGAWHHGTTGTGSPLMPKVYAYGAFWGVGDVIVNGEVATEDGFRVMHFMTTQTIRDERYQLALGEQLPLAPENTIAGQVHHTHGVVLPIRPTDEGPVYDPVPTALELPNGETQPFIHAMWEQDELVEAPFADWMPQDEAGGETPTETSGDADISLGGNAQAWQGRAPALIEGEDNPPLPLEAGTEYTLVWENLDGIQHNFAIADENGEDLLATELVGEEGATQTVEFTASEEMAEYYCQVHPQSMRGRIEIQS